ncbi:MULTISPECIES: hypothetical protein [unclassified Anabaena]|nr:MULTISPECIES: hypothetical protein [unclassified Anabaena]
MRISQARNLSILRMRNLERLSYSVEIETVIIFSVGWMRWGMAIAYIY